MVTSMTYDISDRVEAPEFFDIPNYDYTSEIPPIEGTTDPRADWVAYLDELEEYGCECEIDWKCGVCRENGYRHSRLDAFGLGPDADLAGMEVR
jgi:hypothetical protein